MCRKFSSKTPSWMGIASAKSGKMYEICPSQGLDMDNRLSFLEKIIPKAHFGWGSPSLKMA